MSQYADPYAGEGRWWKGNLHTHTTGSDGALPPEEVARLYARKGYDFLALTDHGVVSEVSPDGAGSRPLLIPGFEFGHGQEHHMLCLGVTQSYGGSCQQVLDVTHALGGVGIVCHPNWLREDYWSPDALRALHHYAGLEVFNFVITRHPGRTTATDDWDLLLSTGCLVWGYANDDAHSPDDIGRAWNMVLSPSLSAEALLFHLQRGHCYATTGLLFDDIGLRDGVIHARVDRSAVVRFVGPYGEVLAECWGSEASFAPQGQHYVRVEAEGPLGRAWSQPFWLVCP